jgi:hypothetical protein
VARSCQKPIQTGPMNDPHAKYTNSIGSKQMHKHQFAIV